MAQLEYLGENVDWIAAVAERKIQDAISEGLFDNLPGIGQPLNLDVNPFEPPGMGAVNRLLKHNRILPPWLLLEQEIEVARSLALGALARWEASEQDLRGCSEFSLLRAQARAAYEGHMRRCNDLILKFNYVSPFALRAPVTMMIRTRLREFDAAYGTKP